MKVWIIQLRKVTIRSRTSGHFQSYLGVELKGLFLHTGISDWVVFPTTSPNPITNCFRRRLDCVDFTDSVHFQLACLPALPAMDTADTCQQLCFLVCMPLWLRLCGVLKTYKALRARHEGVFHWVFVVLGCRRGCASCLSVDRSREC